MRFLAGLIFALLILNTCHSYILLTANMEDVHALASQLVTSPVVDQAKKIWRRASIQFQKEINKKTRRHGGRDIDEDMVDDGTNRHTRRIIRELVALGKDLGYLEPVKKVLKILQ